MTDSSPITISLGGIADFLTAGASQKIAVVRRLVDMYDAPYHPSRDFYRGIREAIDDGIMFDDDDVRVPRAVADSHPNRRDHYSAVAQGWRDWRRRKNIERFADTKYWNEQGLVVRVSPRLVHRQRYTHDLIWPYFKDGELSRDAAQATIRIMELTCSTDGHRPSALDVRRGRLHHPRRRDRDYDTWLRAEVSGLLRMYNALRNAAA
jgi:hypothetical protein